MRGTLRQVWATENRMTATTSDQTTRSFKPDASRPSRHSGVQATESPRMSMRGGPRKIRLGGPDFGGTKLGGTGWAGWAGWAGD